MNKRLVIAFILCAGVSSHAFGMLSSMRYGAALCRATISVGRSSVASLLANMFSKKQPVTVSKAASVPFFTRVQ